MRTRPLGAALTATSLALCALALTGQTSAAAPGTTADSTPGYALRHLTVQVKVGPAGDQTCAVSADLYKPDGASRRHPAPAILTTNGFGGSKDDSNQAAIGKGFVQQGYVVLSYSGLGFGGSGCKIHLDDPDWDGRAGRQMDSVLAGTKAFTYDGSGRTARLGYVAQERPGDPRVGMIGGSYGGQIQYAVAMQDRRIDALVPIITWNDLSYSLAPNNTSATHGVTYATPGVAKKDWIDLFFGDGIADGVQGSQVDPSRNVGCPNFADQACPAAAQLNTAGYPDDAMLQLARHASVVSYLKRITAPTLLVQGQNDTLFNLQESVATYRALHAQGTPSRLVWQSWGHSGSTPAPGELDFGAASLRDSYLGRRFLDWMDHYVRGDRSAPVGPRFSYFRDWVHYDTSPADAGTAIDKAYAERSRFSERRTAALYLTGSDGLTPDAAAVQDGSASYGNTGPAPTSYSETSGVQGTDGFDPPVSDAPGTFAAFTSAPLAHGVAMVGSPRLTLHLSAPVAAGSQDAGPGGQLVLFAKVYDVAPDGTPTLQHRLVSPVRVTDVTKPLRVTLPGVVEHFAKGHRIQVVVAASDAAYAGNAAAQPVTVTTSRTAPGVLRMPLTGPLRLR
ncbi:MAG: CocE/NonD family hydrolase [Nocardioidaceae bacterium]